MTQDSSLITDGTQPSAEVGETIPPDPIARFSDLFQRAKTTEPFDHTAMNLASSTPEGRPSSRVVLLKSFDAGGFVFYTHLSGRKGGELISNPYAALCFYYPKLGEQCRVEGRVEQVSDAEADAYFASRARTSQLGAWASEQSQPLASRADLLRCVAETDARFAGRAVERPPYWTGFRLIPSAIEFWINGEFRLHDRFLYQRADADAPWTARRLNP